MAPPYEEHTVRTRDLLLTLIDACADKDNHAFGRTSLQKMAYFAGHRLGIDLGHRAYHYGPFSDLVDHEVGMLTLGGLVNEEFAILGHGTRGAVRQYRYSLTDEGRGRLKRVTDAHPDETEKVHDLVDRVLEVAGSLEQGLLSQTAKTYFVAEATGDFVGYDELRQVAAEHGWSLEEGQRPSVDKLLAALSEA